MAAFAHECIVDVRPFKESVGISVDDIAKRLIDYGFHAPTMSFPVAGTLMIEPTESESKAEFDRFCEAMIAIHAEIAEVEKKSMNARDNVLRNALHTVFDLTDDDWTHPYSRLAACFPVSSLLRQKYWCPVNRVDTVIATSSVRARRSKAIRRQPNEITATRLSGVAQPMMRSRCLLSRIWYCKRSRRLVAAFYP